MSKKRLRKNNLLWPGFQLQTGGALAVCLFCVFVTVSFSMEPQEILVVTNSRMAGSVELGRYYMEKRGIPANHLLNLRLSLKEKMSRSEFDKDLKKPVNDAIHRLLPGVRIACVVLIYGVPLKVAPTLPDWDSLETIRKLKNELKERRNKTYGKNTETVLKELRGKIKKLSNDSQKASVDSELSLVLAGHYRLSGWIRNPYFIGFQGLHLPIDKDKVLLVCRLDGPDKQTVYRMINDTLAVEQTGLRGTAYFDARWKFPKKKDLRGYALYDASLHRAAKIVRKRMNVILDSTPHLFPVNSCPDVALYCGWYSLAKYVDSFEWNRGAIGYHLASSECTTLRNPDSSVWCVNILKKGGAATIGPVNEPYIQGFPLPEIFFNYLSEGYMSLGETYLVSLPFLSWQMVLVGDPLYQPFSPISAVVEKNK
ncbi:TIGR03790 family protein [Desulfomarina sp.]